MEDRPIGSGMAMGLEQEIFAELSAELSIADEDFDENLLLSKVRSSIRSIKGARKYQNNPEYFNTEERIEKDLYEYFENIMGLALDRYSRIGADGESSHSENGISRTYENEKRWFSGVIPISPPPGK